MTRAAADGAAGPAPEDAIVPTATYRLQFHRGFTFADAAGIVPYLHALGISHGYASPYLKARSGSLHGYDIIDHNALNPEIGDEESFECFVAALRKHGMGQILDMVPNHMMVMESDNAWWLDVLENGPSSRYARFFDIDWNPAKAVMRGKVLVPVLGDHYGAVIERRELELAFDRERGGFRIVYPGHAFPLAPESYPLILLHRLERLEARLGDSHPDLRELQALADALRRLPPRTESDPDRSAERLRDQDIYRGYLAALAERSAAVREFIEANVGAFNQDGERLHGLLATQSYRLAYWRVAADEINYRRFFDINDLAALRMEHPDVFEATHALVLRWLESGALSGLRIDHPDGLYDPPAYFDRIQRRFRSAGAANGAARPVYLLAEKILASYERLPAEWSIHGTTGYDFANLVNGLFVDPEREGALNRIYQSFIREKIDFDDLLYRSKRLIMKVSLASELSVLANQLSRIAEADPRTCDFTLNALRDALTEVVACFPVYRTYITAAGVAPSDQRYIDWAVAVARRRSQAADVSIFDFVRRVLSTEAGAGRPDAYRAAVTAFAMRFQQYTAPVMAKAMEDTTFYIYHRLGSLNEVGGDPRRFGTSVAAFHHANKEREQQWPDGMLSTSTHDTKRSEDVRARLNVLSELSEEWRRRLTRWTRLNRSKKRRLDDRPAPSRNDEYLLYQTLIGAWPLEPMNAAELAAFRGRIAAYMLKAVREAKVHTSWMNAHTEYEEAVESFVDGLLGRFEDNPFLRDLAPFAARVSRFGLFNGLAQTLLKLTAPGVPDIYQGNELWDFSLVDPDNRRPVDYPRRREALARLQSFGSAPPDRRIPAVQQLLASLADGSAKLYVIWKTLTLRREHPGLFRRGEYIPLNAAGAGNLHVCAFARRRDARSIIVIAPRLVATLTGGSESAPVGADVWKDATIRLPADAPDVYENVFTGEAIAVRPDGEGPAVRAAEALAHFPVALLRGEARL